MPIPLSALRPYASATSGISRGSFNSPFAIPWRHPNGDWRDALGVPQGGTPFAEVAVSYGATLVTYHLDVTSLWRAWQQGSVPNHGLLLHATTVVALHSDDAADEAVRPLMVLTLQDGITPLPVEADCVLTQSSSRPLGGSASYRVTQSDSVVIGFDHTAVAELVVKAELVVTSWRRYGTGKLMVFRVDITESRPEPPGRLGIAAGFYRDERLETHPSIWMAESFEADAIGQPHRLYERGWGGTNARALSIYASKAPGAYVVVGDHNPADPSYEPLAPGIKSFVVGAEPVTLLESAGGCGRWWYRAHYGLPDPSHAFFRYCFRMSEQFNPAPEGGKWPGWDGSYMRGIYQNLLTDDDPPFGGNGRAQSTGYNGWTIRGGYNTLYRSSAADDGFYDINNNPLYQAGYRDIYGYAYVESLQRNVSYTGIRVPFGLELAGIPKKNTWYTLDSEVKLNTISADMPEGLHDGYVRYWLAECGKPSILVCDRQELRFRKWRPSGRQIGVLGLWMAWQHGGLPDWVAEPTRLYLTGFAMGNEFIGPPGGLICSS